MLAAALTAGALLFAPPVHADAAIDGAPDVRKVAFGQVDAHFELTVQTTGDVCVVIDPGGRLCATKRTLRYRGRSVHATVRTSAHTLHAQFGTGEIPLRRGAFDWWVEAGTDRVPDSGAFTASLTTLAQPDCFAAAARDKPCRNPALRNTLVPNPDDAPLVPNAPCRITVRSHCEFGVTSTRRRATFALLGDSHAATWRAALEVVAQAKRWRGVSITRPGCPFSTRIPASPDLGPAACRQLQQATLNYLRASGIKTVFVSSWAQPPTGPHNGTADYGGNADAFGAMLDRLPKSVRHVYVLRDNPGTTLNAPTCLCASPRARVLTPDPLAAAARTRGPRMRVIDLTRFFCGPTSCHAKIGNAYVYKDDNHMNSVFATSLGPFVLRALRNGP